MHEDERNFLFGAIAGAFFLTLIIMISGCSTLRGYQKDQGFKKGYAAMVSYAAGNPVPAYELGYITAVRLFCGSDEIVEAKK